MKAGRTIIPPNSSNSYAVSGTGGHVWYHSRLWVGGVRAYRRLTFVLAKSFIVDVVLTLVCSQCTLQKIIHSLQDSFTLGQACRVALPALLRVMQLVLSAIQYVISTVFLSGH